MKFMIDHGSFFIAKLCLKQPYIIVIITIDWFVLTILVSYNAATLHSILKCHYDQILDFHYFFSHSRTE